jgi:hypothetical protein
VPAVQVTILTVDNRGTPGDRSDDLPLAGATYAVIQDDGDGVFDRSKDGPVIAQLSSTGVTTLRGLPQAPYWVVETVAPPGYDLAGALPFAPKAPSNPGQSCFDAGTVTCYADSGGGGLTSVFFVNAPLAVTAQTGSALSPLALIVLIVAVVAVVGGGAYWYLRRRRA